MTSVLDTPTGVSPSEDGRRRWAVPRPDRWGLGILLTATAVLYLWNLSINGYANSFYSAAIQAGSQSWKAWFFGSSDAGNSITVDKPPVSLWIPGISVRIFGLNSWSILVPQVLMGVASVALLYLIVKKYLGVSAGLLAGAALALTPVATLMFRFNNPDALLVLLMIAAVWATLKGIEDGRIRWMVLTGVLVGIGFLTKQLQVFLVIPPLAITYLAFGQHTWLKRLGHLITALVAMLVSAGWWVLAVTFWPKDSRPFIGGSQNNSILELTFGYNGFGRLTGNETGSVVPGGGNRSGAAEAATGAFGGQAPGGVGGPGGRGGMWGETGLFRMFQPEQGGQIAWLIPTALILGIAALVLCGRSSRTNIHRALISVWMLWLLTTTAVFSFMSGIFHAYYTVALAPAIAALVGAGGVMCWKARDTYGVRIVLAVAVAVTGAMSFFLLNRSSDFVPWLRWVVVVLAVVAAVALVVPKWPRAAAIAAAVAIVMGLAGPTAYALDTVTTAKNGPIVSAGPSQGGFGPGGMGGRRGGMRGGFGPGGFGGQAQGGQTPGGQISGGFGGQMPPGMAQGGGQQGGATPGAGTGSAGSTMAERFGGMGGPGGFMQASKPSTQLVELLESDSDEYTWVAATVTAMSAAGYQLATQDPVMPIGGFNGSDPSPTLAQFQEYVRQGKIHYFIGGGMMGGGMNAEGTATQIREWVTANYTEKTVGSVTLYDLTQPKS
ncbi:ArnT family glycosyltransferase [Williamsia phyllosphaerae]|uniref:Glycosyl transferase n=1 Tax=Williamsia phyllosphaerae TaxID=885042 RepID=A0ABQ1U1X5_9NOCA|nr:glycosyltransferase family 39 protein [Williamsia phyllosphaerae]GGF08936.1 hypothetical protein GCM10007298_01030 [Williamsia phyllosphaerae]